MITLPEALKLLAEENTRGFTFLHEDGKEYFFSYAEIYQKSCQRASALKNEGLVKGDRIAIILPELEDFIFTFYGAILAGIIPVPIYPPIRPDITVYLEIVGHINKTSQCRAVVTVPPIKRRLKSTATIEEKIITSKELDRGYEVETHNLQVTLDDTAFIQFTSGTTAYPKGVVITYRNIASNVACFMREGMGVKKEDIGVTWLPLYHDMGLIGCVFGPIYYNMPMTFMPALMFIKKPVEWLRLITRHKATISFAPNFAYGLCTARIKDNSGLNLSSWRVAGCGSEPISYETLKNFSRHFKTAGFREDSFVTAYGMAESTLAISFSKLGEGMVADKVNSDSLRSKGMAIPCEEPVRRTSALAGGKGCTTVVSCGKPFSSHELVILDETGNALPEHCVGEIVIKGPSVMKGYYNNEQETQNTIRDGWLHTGDLGYIVGGNIYVCGRKKDLIIIAGKNYYPQDIEWAVNKVEGVRRGNVVAFGLEKELTESIVVVVESRVWKRKGKEIKEGIRNAVLNTIGIRVDRIEVLSPGTLPKTSSGKLQRSKTKELFKAGKLTRRSYGKGMVQFLRKRGTKANRVP